VEEKLSRETLLRILGDGLSEVPERVHIEEDNVARAIAQLEADVPELRGLSEWKGEESDGEDGGDG